MRLYNAHSCTPVVVVPSQTWSSWSSNSSSNGVGIAPTPSGVNRVQTSKPTLKSQSAAAQPVAAGGPSTNNKTFSIKRTGIRGQNVAKKIQAMWPPTKFSPLPNNDSGIADKSKGLETTSLDLSESDQSQPRATATETTTPPIPVHQDQFHELHRFLQSHVSPDLTRSTTGAHVSDAEEEEVDIEDHSLMSEVPSTPPVPTTPPRGRDATNESTSTRRRQSAFHSPLRLANFHSGAPVPTFKTPQKEHVDTPGPNDEFQVGPVTPKTIEWAVPKRHPKFRPPFQSPKRHWTPGKAIPTSHRNMNIGNVYRSPSHDPSLHKNETQTTQTTTTASIGGDTAFDALPGRVSSESFHFDIELLHSTEDQLPEELEEPGFEESVISRSSSSTLTTQWPDDEAPFHATPNTRLNLTEIVDPFLEKKHSTDEGQEEENLEADEHPLRPLSPVPWSDFYVPTDEAEPLGPVRADMEERPAPIIVERRRISQDPATIFDKYWSEERWSDDDNSWIDFTADPFRGPSAQRPVPSRALESSVTALKFEDPIEFENKTTGLKLQLAMERTSLVAIEDLVVSKQGADIPPKLQANKSKPLTTSKNTSNTSKFAMSPAPRRHLRTASPGEAHPGPRAAARRVPMLLGSLLQAKYQKVLCGKHKQDKKSDSVENESIVAKDKVEDEPTVTTDKSSCAPPELPHETSSCEVVPKSAASHSGNLQLVPSKLPEKYAKMLRMGLPEGAIRNAMQRDGVRLSDNVDDPRTSATPEKTRTRVSPPDSVRRVRIHWQTHEDVRSNTVWAMVQRDSVAVRIPDRDMQRLFSEATEDSTTSRRRAAMTNNAQQKTPTVIDAKRASNGGILLARMPLSYKEIASVIDKCDYHEFTSVEQIQALFPLIPTDKEVIALRAHISKVGGIHLLQTECERFMANLLTVKNVKGKLEAMLSMKEFPVSIQELGRDARCIRDACEDIMSSTRLRKVLGLVLEVGNRLNTAGPSSKGPAQAVRLESLSQLSYVKALDRKTTLLHFLASICQDEDQSWLQLRQELPNLMRVQKMDISNVQEDLAQWESRLFEIQQMAEAAEGNLANTPIGRFTLHASTEMMAASQSVQSAQASYAALVDYFGETADCPIFQHLSTFCRDCETALEYVLQERASRRQRPSWKTQNHAARGHSLDNNPSTLEDNNPNHHPTRRAPLGRVSPAEPIHARSGVGNTFLDSVRCKTTSVTEF